MDFWGAKTSYAYDDASAANKVPGLMSRETNALNEVTSYTYAQMPGQVNKSFADMFQKYVNHQIGDDSGQTGYLTSAQSLPTAISMDATGRDSVTTLTYDMAAGSASEFQPKEFGAPGGTGGKLDYEPATGKLAEVKVLDAQGQVATRTANEYYEAGVGVPGWKVGMLQKTTVFASASDATGRSTEYNYRREGTHLISTTRDPLTGLASQSETDATGNLTSSTSAMNQTVIARSDGEGRGIEAYDEQGNRVVSFYNVLGQKVLERLVHVYETGVAPMVILTRTSYDEGGRVTKVSRETDKGRVLSVNETAYEQTSWGRMETSKGTDGLASRSYYDAGGRLTKSEQLDASGGVMSWGAFTYDLLGRKIAETSSQGAVTSTTYDSLGRVVKTQTKAPGVDMISETGYDAAGRVTSMTQPTDQHGMRYTHNRYDDLGRLVQTYYNSTSKVLNPAQAGLTSTTTTYDNLGRREYAYNEEGIATRYVYDASGRMKETWLGAVPLAGIAGVRYQYEYDDFGNVTRIVDPMGHDRIKKYNAKGQLWREYTAAGDEVYLTDLETNRQVVEYTYYTGGQLKEKKQGVAVGVEGTHTFTRSTTYEYDPATGQMVKETASQDGLVQLVTARTYDGLNDRLAREEVRNGNNAVVHWKGYAYDPKTGKESLVTSPEGSISYTYHKDGNLASISTGSGQSNSYTYDAMGRIVRLQSTVLGPQNQPKAVTYEYSSSLGLQKRVNYPNGTWEEKKYDERGWLSWSKLTLTDGFKENTYLRDKQGLITGTFQDIYTDGAWQTVGYNYTNDNLGRLTQSWMEDMATGSVVYGYEYDPAGNRTKRTEKTFDDWVGDFVVRTLNIYTFNPLNQCVFEYQDREGVENETELNYDIYGNLVREHDYDSSNYYTWDVKDRLATIIGGGKAVTFTYDAEGQRIRKHVAQGANPPTTSSYLTDNQNPSGYSQTLEETNKAGAPTAAYAWGSGGVLAQRTGAGIVADGSNSQSALASPDFVHADNVGSVRLMSNVAGNAKSGSSYYYEPFGTLLSTGPGTSSNPGLSSLKFTGQFADGDVGGLQYHRARWLNTTRAGWLSADPVYDFPGNFGNGYGYAGQSPVNTTDLSGMFSDIGVSVMTMAICASLGAIAGGYLGGIRGAVAGALIGATIGAGLAGWVFLELFNGAMATIGIAAGSILALYWFSKGGAPQIATPGPAGFVTQSPNGATHNAFISIAQGSARAGGGPNQFGEHMATKIAQVLYSNGYSVTYGCPANRQDFEESIRQRKYDIFYVLGHGGADTDGNSLVYITPTTYLSVREIANILRNSGQNPKLAFVDGCSMQNGKDSILAQSVITSNRIVAGAIGDQTISFFVTLFANCNGDVEKAFQKIYVNRPYSFSGKANLNP